MGILQVRGVRQQRPDRNLFVLTIVNCIAPWPYRLPSRVAEGILCATSERDANVLPIIQILPHRNK